MINDTTANAMLDAITLDGDKASRKGTLTGGYMAPADAKLALQQRLRDGVVGVAAPGALQPQAQEPLGPLAGVVELAAGDGRLHHQLHRVRKGRRTGTVALLDGGHDPLRQRLGSLCLAARHLRPGERHRHLPDLRV
jgi:hypothetical protein